MRTQRKGRALLASLTMSAGLVATNSLVGAPAGAWSRYDAPPTAENFEALRYCESGNDYSIDTGNGYYGAYQFSPETWWWLGFEGWPHQASPEEQDHAAWHLYQYSHWDAWPACSRGLGLR